VEQLLRFISWAVVLGAVFALAYAGLKPVLQEYGFPPVDESQVGGAILAPADAPAGNDPLLTNGEGPDGLPENQLAATDCDSDGEADERCPPRKN